MTVSQAEGADAENVDISPASTQDAGTETIRAPRTADEPSQALLEHQQVVDYWDSRHQDLGSLLSGGDVTYDHAANEAFYAIRLGRLLDIINPVSPPQARRRLLDAGCGKGWFSHALARCGYRVDGIDSSTHAIAEAVEGAIAGETFAVSTLHEWAPPHLYDVVVSVDVLFHLTDDEVWARSVRNLASLTATTGRLVIADQEHSGKVVHGSYQVTRGSELYREVLQPLGMGYHGFSPYRFRSNQVGFHHFEWAA